MKTIIMVLVIAVVALSCSKNEKPIKGFVYEVNVDFNILNQNGEDLLNSKTSGYFPFEDMKLFYLINGEKVEVFDPNLDFPRSIMLITETSPYTLRCFTSSSENGFTHEENGLKIGTATAYLQLNVNDTDTLITEWTSGDYSFVNSEIWYNGEFHERGSKFQIIK